MQRWCFLTHAKVMFLDMCKVMFLDICKVMFLDMCKVMFLDTCKGDVSWHVQKWCFLTCAWWCFLTSQHFANRNVYAYAMSGGLASWHYRYTVRRLVPPDTIFFSLVDSFLLLTQFSLDQPFWEQEMLCAGTKGVNPSGLPFGFPPLPPPNMRCF